MDIVNGHTGTSHISSSDLRSLFKGLVKDGTYLLTVGNNLSASMTTANNCRVLDGDLIIQGVHSRIIEAEYEDLTIANGAVGYNRKDIVAWHYVRNAGTAVEATTLVVVQGTAVTGTASDPAMPVVGVLRDGDLEHYQPIYRISLNGLTVAAPVLLVGTSESLNSVRPILLGGTGGTTAAVARDNLGIDDSVMYENTAGAWNYREWHSGKIELWQTVTWTTAISAAWGSQFISEEHAAVNYPFALASAPQVFASCRGAEMAVPAITSAGTASATPKFRLSRGETIGSTTFLVDLYIVGALE